MNVHSKQNPSPSDWALFPLTGKTFSFDIELSSTECGCNAALYMVSMKGQTGYCDANNVGGKWCNELDIMEANKHSIHITPHCCCSRACNGNDGSMCLSGPQSSYTVCDQWGIGGGFGGGHGVGFDSANSYGAGGQFLIDATKKYNYAITFGSNRWDVNLSQEGRKAHLAITNSNYINRMNAYLSEGMAFVFSLWSSSDMTWMDGGEAGCHAPESCNLAAAHATWSNFKIN